jgi:DNA-binding response OmpR family regulator
MGREGQDREGQDREAQDREEHDLRHRVLIVDDDESTRLLLARLLSQELNVDAQLAGTSEQALRFAGNYAYDAILLDLMMPGIGGLAVLKEIRSASPNSATPIIVVSTMGDAPTMDQCLKAGASAYHMKPVRRAELVATLKAQLAARGKPKTTEK